LASGTIRLKGWRSRRGALAAVAAWAGVALFAPAFAAPQTCPQGAEPPRVVKLQPHERIDSSGPAPTLLAPGEVVLTFDDGPVPGITSQVLDILSAACLRATFFTIGEEADRNPRLLARILAEGHTLGGHGATHRPLSDMRFKSAIQDIQNGFKPLMLAGAPARYFRYPHLDETNQINQWLAERGVAIVDADIDSQDWTGGSADDAFERIVEGLEEEGGGVIIMHDNQRAVIKYLPRLIDYLRTNGFRVVHLDGGGP
jgi:peptidoglycan/xylan/chitin deacetylase (PgdA/CDA1 family)